jgi:hypothetical protein
MTGNIRHAITGRTTCGAQQSHEIRLPMCRFGGQETVKAGVHRLCHAERAQRCG